MAYTDKSGKLWNELNTTSLPTSAKLAYEAFQAANKVASDKRKAFEAIMREEMGTDAVAFGYKWGKLTFTTDVEAKTVSSGKAAMSLSDWLDRENAR